MHRKVIIFAGFQHPAADFKKPTGKIGREKWWTVRVAGDLLKYQADYPGSSDI